MIGRLQAAERRAVVVGGGIAGLLAAYRLDRAGFAVELFEASDRLGGLVRTNQTQYGLSEAAIHSTLVSPPVRELFGELGVELVPVNADARSRYIWRKGRMRRMPLGVSEAAVALAKAYFALPAKDVDPDTLTLDEWARHHLGRAALDYLLTPFVRGIYACRPSEISVAAAFPGLFPTPGHSLLSQTLMKARKRRGPRVKKPMMTARDGMLSLVAALESRLRDSRRTTIHLGTRVDRLPNAPNIFVCSPADAASKLLAPECGELSRALAAIEYAPLVSVTAFLPKSASAPRGVGVLVPEVERDRRCLGVLFNSASFPGRAKDGYASYTMMIGGTSQRELTALDDGELRSLVETELRAIVGEAKPIHLEIHRWPRAIPVYSPELYRTLKIAEISWCARPGRILFANWTGQVSLRGMIEAVAGLAPTS